MLCEMVLLLREEDLPIGTVHQWAGGKYRKTVQGWVPAEPSHQEHMQAAVDHLNHQWKHSVLGKAFHYKAKLKGDTIHVHEKGGKKHKFHAADLPKDDHRAIAAHIDNQLS